MTMLGGFAPPAPQTVVRAGLLARAAGHGRLGSEFFLLALAQDLPGTSPVDLGVSAAAVRARIGGPDDGELLSGLGIDRDEVRRRAGAVRQEDPGRWHLRRSVVRPLRVTLSGPVAEIVLDEGGRKIIEVARGVSRRRGRPLASREDLLWGLLADGSGAAVRILLGCGGDLRRLWADLQRVTAAG